MHRMELLEIEIVEHVHGVATSIPSLHNTQRHSTKFLQHTLYLLLLTVLPNLPQ